MPARSFGYAEVEERLQKIRRRLNSLALQHAAYSAATVALLLATGLKLLGIYAGPVAYEIAYWPTILAVVGSLFFGVRSALRRRATVESAARLADVRAKLKDRLATLHAHGRLRSSSRLVDVVYSDVLNYAPRWKASALGVRRVPRMAYALALSASLFLVTRFLARPDESKPMPAPHPRPLSATAEEQSPPKPEREQKMKVTAFMPSNAAANGPSSRGQKNGGGSGSSAQLGSGIEPDAEADRTSSGNASARLAKADVPKGQIGRDGLSRSAGQVDGGSKVGDDDSPHSNDPKDRSRSGRDRSSAGAIDKKPGADGKPDAAKAKDANGHPEPGASEGSRSARGGKGSEAGGLFGSKPGEADGKVEPHSFALRLTRSTTANIQMDPQGKGEPANAGAVGSAGNATMPDGAGQEAPDGALHRAEVAPEHEAILGRIFRRN
jgi:hypothetical protein